jgi:hypothetical protein
VSDWDAKLATRAPQTEGRAQAARSTLLARRGAREVDVDTVHIDTMGGREVWRRLVKKSTRAAGDYFEQLVRS